MAAAYEWISHRYSIDPNLVGRTVEQIEKRDGFCHPGALVDYARPDESPLHPLFEWDDRHAAEEYRKGQARRIIASLTTVDAEVKNAPAFISVRLTAEEGSYMSTSKARQHPDYLDFALQDAKRQLSYIRKRYSLLKELQSIWDEIDKAA